MKYYIIAGEASGDLHGSNLIKELQKLDPHSEIRCWGGDRMQATGATLVKHFKDLAFMGFVEVLTHLRIILKNIDFCKKDILTFAPDVLIFIDYPGFNLRIAKWAKSKAIRTVYYISPQVWAWKESRVPSMMKSIDKMLVILPFEKSYFKDKFNWDVQYVGHPLVKVITDFRSGAQKLPSLSDRKIIALLPGSRKQEIRKKLPIMLEVAKIFPDYEFIIARAPSIEDSFYSPFVQNYPNVDLLKDQTYHLLSQSKAALVTSGTATLETALFGVPEIVCYKGNPVSYAIAKKLIKVKFISLVNIIMDKLVVKELIQHELNQENLITELTELLENTQRQTQIQKDYAELNQILAMGGNASLNAAIAIFGDLSHK